MDLNTFLMRKQASPAGGPYNISNVRESNGWVYDPVTKSAIPVQEYYRYGQSYGDENSVSLQGEDEFNQFASKYDGNTFDFQAYNAGGRDLGRYDANQMHAQRAAQIRQENEADAARRDAEAANYENSAQWQEYKALMARRSKTNPQPGAGASQNNVYGDGVPAPTGTPDATTAPAAPPAAPPADKGAPATPPATTTTGVTDASAPGTPATSGKNPKKQKSIAGVGPAVGSATVPKDTGGHISRDQALMLLHQGYAPTSIGGWTQAYDSTLPGEHLARMKQDSNYNPFGHYTKQQADRIISNSTTPETMNFNGTKYNLKDPLEARKYQAARAAYKAKLDPNSAEYKRLFPSNKRYTVNQLKQQDAAAARLGYIPMRYF